MSSEHSPIKKVGSQSILTPYENHQAPAALSGLRKAMRTGTCQAAMASHGGFGLVVVGMSTDIAIEAMAQSK